MLGYGPEDKSAVLELTYNYGVTEYDKGNAYAQVKKLANYIYGYMCYTKININTYLPLHSSQKLSYYLPFIQKK